MRKKRVQWMKRGNDGKSENEKKRLEERAREREKERDRESEEWGGADKTMGEIEFLFLINHPLQLPKASKDRGSQKEVVVKEREGRISIGVS